MSADDSVQLGRKGGADLDAVPVLVELCFANAQLGYAACSVDASSCKKAALDLTCLMTLYMPCLQLYIH